MKSAGNQTLCGTRRAAWRRCSFVGHFLIWIAGSWILPADGDGSRLKDLMAWRAWDRVDSLIENARNDVDQRKAASLERAADSSNRPVPSALSVPADARDASQREPGNRRAPVEVRMPTQAFRTEVPAHAVDYLLARPTKNSVALSVLAYEAHEGRVTWEDATGNVLGETPWLTWPKDEPVELVLNGLRPATRHRYELQYRKAGTTDPILRRAHSFTTAPPPGTPFVFALQADSHLDFGTDPEIYRASLQAVLASKADFLIDLGDTFMTDKYLRFTDAAAHYRAQRYYLGLVGHSLPVFLALGNHDGERSGQRRGSAASDPMSIWSNAMRKRHFPNPVPDSFYSGNASPHPEAGMLQNYYAWEWGDALFIVLDPYWYSVRQRNRASEPLDQWGWTLGEDQYRWLAGTLATSKAAFKFVFTHQLVGGATREGRGGLAAATVFEWGGRDVDGRDSFRDRRPGWGAPIHDLLVRHGGSVVFHGHDHMYARGELNGVVYQLVPQPGHGRPSTRSAGEYGYAKEKVLPGSGILRVQVSPSTARVDYLQIGSDRVARTAESYGLAPRASQH